MNAGEKIYNELVELERRLWTREDYGEEDITLFSNAMDFIADNLAEFTEYFDKKGKK